MKILLNRALAQLAPFGSINPFGSISPLAETMGRGGWWKQQGLARMPHRKVHYWKTQMIMLLVTGSELLAFLCEQAVFALLGGIGKTFSSAEPKNRPSPRLSTPFWAPFWARFVTTCTACWYLSALRLPTYMPRRPDEVLAEDSVARRMQISVSRFKAPTAKCCPNPSTRTSPPKACLIVAVALDVPPLPPPPPPPPLEPPVPGFVICRPGGTALALTRVGTIFFMVVIVTAPLGWMLASPPYQPPRLAWSARVVPVKAPTATSSWLVRLLVLASLYSASAPAMMMMATTRTPMSSMKVTPLRAVGCPLGSAWGGSTRGGVLNGVLSIGLTMGSGVFKAGVVWGITIHPACPNLLEPFCVADLPPDPFALNEPPRN